MEKYTNNTEITESTVVEVPEITERQPVKILDIILPIKAIKWLALAGITPKSKPNMHDEWHEYLYIVKFDGLNYLLATNTHRIHAIRLEETIDSFDVPIKFRTDKLLKFLTLEKAKEFYAEVALYGDGDNHATVFARNTPGNKSVLYPSNDIALPVTGMILDRFQFAYKRAKDSFENADGKFAINAHYLQEAAEFAKSYSSPVKCDNMVSSGPIWFFGNVYAHPYDIHWFSIVMGLQYH